MKDVSILDCTLRDGGYLVNGLFGDMVIKGIIESLTQSGVDYIEVGFLKNEPHTEGSTIFNNSKQIEAYLPQNRNAAEYVCLADFSRYSIENLDDCTGNSITGVRACFFKYECKDVIPFCNGIKDKGYKLFVQPVDILGYSDAEILELLSWVNEVKPFAFSIVDTFGSMYPDDLIRLISLINHNLAPQIKMGFHSHNNLQMSFSLAQEFIKCLLKKREIFIDTTLAGMGRGAGNANTELVMNYLNKFYLADYDLNTVLDTIDNYILGYKSKQGWGYSIPLFLAGVHSSHVNNISYLLNKSGIESRDINCILESLTDQQRKRYDYGNLENLYQIYMKMDTDDADSLKKIDELFKNKKILIVLPGHSIVEYSGQLVDFYENEKPEVICVNIISDIFDKQTLYFNNINRYKFWKNHELFGRFPKIITSNIDTSNIYNQIVVDYGRLAESEYMDNSAILLLRLLDYVDASEIYIAGFDGFNDNAFDSGYAIEAMEKPRNNISADELNKDIEEGLARFFEDRKKKYKIKLLTRSRFESFFETSEIMDIKCKRP